MPAGTLEILDDVDEILSSPNTVIFPPGSARRQEAFDAYVLEDADLEAALADAEQITLDFQACVAAIPDDVSDFDQQWQTCVEQADPD